MVKEIKSIPDENGCDICTSHCKCRGYPYLTRDKKHWRMSRWLYTQKHGEIPKGKIIRHKCDNPACINLNHLELGTHKDNVYDMIKRNRALYGEKHPMTKLTEQQVINIYHDRGRTQKEIANEYDLNYVTISNIQSGKNWGSLFKKHNIIPKGKGKAIGEAVSGSKLTKVQVKEIRKLYKTGKYSHRQLGKMYSVSFMAIGNILRKQTWKHVK